MGGEQNDHLSAMLFKTEKAKIRGTPWQKVSKSLPQFFQYLHIRALFSLLELKAHLPNQKIYTSSLTVSGPKNESQKYEFVCLCIHNYEALF